MKDALGHGSDAKGSHASKVDQVGKVSAMFNTWGQHPALWDKNAFDKIRASNEFGSEIAKLPQIKGTVYRGLPETDLSKYKPGTDMVLGEHTAVTTTASSAEPFSTNSPSFRSGTPVLMQIENARAADFGSTGQSQLGTKEDLILPMGTKLHVTAVEPRTFQPARGRSKKGYVVKMVQR